MARPALAPRSAPAVTAFIISVALCLNIAGMTIAIAVNLVQIVLRTVVPAGQAAAMALANLVKVVQAVPRIAALVKSQMIIFALMLQNAKAVIAFIIIAVPRQLTAETDIVMNLRMAIVKVVRPVLPIAVVA